MKINHREVKQELEDWAAEIGWKNVAALIAEHHADFRKSACTVSGLHNVEQTIKRAFRGKTAYYQRKASELMPYVLAALPVQRRYHLDSPDDPVLLATFAAKESVEAVNAIFLRAAPTIALRELNEAISAFKAIKSVIEPLCAAGAR
ncbi:toxin YdaT family protein [Pantoea agglomerans]|uniref:toxin YdaT family protein n=1 Tax=Enterobacter agglomerans TaxID=549 RepID=UPI003C7E171A